MDVPITRFERRRTSRPVSHRADWRTGLPVITLAGATLREIQLADAPSLLAHLGAAEVSRFIAPPPSVETFERYITRALLDRQLGRYACFGLVPAGSDTAAGVFQLRPLEADFGVAEWGFALGAAFWGTGLFVPAAMEVLAFAFETVGVHRLEARAAVSNGRCQGALRKLGAVQEGVLRRSHRHNGVVRDEILWSLLADDWRRARLSQQPRIH